MDLPVEWTRGDPDHIGSIGWVLIQSAAFGITAGLLTGRVLPSLGYPPNYSAFEASLSLYWILITSLVIVWIALVPRPASLLGMSTGGVTIVYGGAARAFPWSRAFVSGDRLFIVSPRIGFATAFRLTPFQVSRLAHWRPSSA
jgi:hypothetical protein